MIKEIIGDCTLYLADCSDIVGGIGPVDALVCDPPYEFKTSGGGHMRRERKCLEQIIGAGLDQGFDLSIINPLLYRSAVVFCHNDQLHKVLPHMAGCYERYALCFWEKKNPPPFANKHYLPNVEPYIHAWSKGAHPIGTIAQKRRTILTNNGKSDIAHPTVKPDDVMDKIIANVNGDTVIDPFMGSASTGVACIKAGKKFIGIEKSAVYFEIACERIKSAYDEKIR